MRNLVSFFLSLLSLCSIAQTGTEFWMAPPDVTYRHNLPGDEPIFLNVTSGSTAATVTVSQPANPAFNGGTPIVLNVPANTAQRYDLTSLKVQLETRPTDQVLNTGLSISSTADITCYYESSNSNNPDIMALKGANGLGLEFYIPLHKHAPFSNHDYSAYPNDLANASFDIVATENNTSVMIYSPVDVDGHSALTPFTIYLNRGQTYSCSNTDLLTHTDPSTHPSGAVVLSDKPIAVSIKDDSNHNPSGGCYDLMLDQIVPVDILGTDYVAVKGQLNTTGDESLFIMAVQNNTDVYIDGAATPVTTLFAGQIYRRDMDYLGASTDNSTFISATKPVYAIHVTGFGCEQGMAILPPLNCAGSRQLSFTRSTSEAFYLNLLVRSGSEDDFTVTGPGTAAINASSFLPVPGTAGEWMAAQIQFNQTQVPVNQAFIVSNTTDVFSLAIINGGGATGCRYGFFSEFAGKIIVDAGVDQDLCVGEPVTLVGSVNGGSTTGIWTTNGGGSFSPSDTDLSATYVPSAGDAALGSITITLTSTGNCTPEQDDLTVNFQQLPIPDAGIDEDVCSNNPSITLAGSVLNAVGGVWSGGAGTFSPSNTDMNATYIPTAGEVNSGSLTLTLTSAGNGDCSAVADDITITFTVSPTANAGADQVLCSNNPDVSLSGSFTLATGGIWSGGGGTFDPSTTNMSADYTPSAAEVAAGSVILTLTTTGNGNCNAVSDQLLLTFSSAPTAVAGSDVTVCENNAATALNGYVTIATGGLWTGGTGTFDPDQSTLGATYHPSASEIAVGSVTLTLTTTGNGNCSAVSDDKTITITPAPVVDAGTNGIVCATGGPIALNGSVTVATGGLWSGGAGTFTPSNSSLTASYQPNAAEIASGGVTLYLTSVGNGTCAANTNDVTFGITAAPTVNAGIDQTLCSNNPDATLNSVLTVATGVQWSGGTGSYAPASNAQNVIYTASPTEIASGSVILTATTTGNGTCAAESDQVQLNFSQAPTANAGADVSVSSNNADVSLNGTYNLSSGGQWSGGLGTFNPSNSAGNAVYSPTAAEIASGSLTLTYTTTGNGNCNASSDQMTITFSAAPTVDAGIDQSVCANNAAISLSGSVTIATGGIWSGGGGTYSPANNDLNAVYTPSAAELLAGSITLTLTSVGNGNSVPVSDQVTIIITPAPTVSAGIDQNSCANAAQVNLAGAINNATGGIWSGGLGTFNPSNTNISASYLPTAGEIITGSVTLTLSSTGNGNCNAVSDQMTISIADAPIISAGSDIVACSNNPTSSLSGSISNATGVIWSGGTGTFSPSITALSPQYTPSANELLNGSVTLTITSTGNGTCAAESDDVLLVFSQSPTVNAGADQTVCEHAPSTTLSGLVTIATGAVWTGGSGTFVPNSNDLNATYTPSPAEIALGSATLTLTSTSNGNCLPESDQVTITIIASPQANAGTDLFVCANNSSVQLGASVTGAGGGQWSGGAGTFTPTITALNATYNPTAAEVNAGSLTLTLTSIGNGSCPAVSDDVLITFTTPPTVDAGTPTSLCANNADIALAGAVTVASGGTWSGAQGTFTPDNTSLITSYTPSLGEVTAGYVTLVLTSTGNQGCAAVTDTITYTFAPAPTADAGNDTSICASAAQVQLTGAVTLAAGGLWSNGNGTFSPGPGSLNATYTPSSLEVSAGGVTLLLSTVGNGNCNAVIDSVHITIEADPIVNAGPDQLICANDPGFQLAGFVGNASGGQWSGGSGTFFPASNALVTSYQPTAAEILSGSITLTLSSTGATVCSNVSDQLTITFSDAPVVDAGTDISVCLNNSVVQLLGNVLNASGGTWTGGSGTFNPSANVLSPTYTPSTSELAAGTMSLILTSTGNGNCLAVTDTVQIIFTASPTINAGSDQNVCFNNAVVQLNGVVNSATGGTWSGGLGTYSTSANDLLATYTLAPFEIQSGSVILTLTSTGNGNCTAVQDQVTFTVTPAPVVDAGSDLTVCANNLSIPLNGTVQGGATTGEWTSSGTGTFFPSANVLNGTYQASAQDSIAGTVTLSLSSTNNGLCNVESDQLTISILPNAVADAGSDQSLCTTEANIQLSGSITGNATEGIWTTNGFGTFTPDSTVANAIYQVDPSDAALGTLNFTWTINSCDNASDQSSVSLIPASSANAGADQVTCVSDLNIVVNASISGASSTGNWSSTGSGTFVSGTSALANIYQASSADSLAQSVDLIISADNTGVCAAASDTMHIDIFPFATVDAGLDESFCANNVSLQLNGSLTGTADVLQWTTSGNGTFAPNATVLTPFYTPSPADTANGNITLTLAAVNSCNSANDAMQLVLTPAPFVNAGPDQTYCNLVTQFNLSGVVSGITQSGQWSTTGTGTIANPAASSTTYTASQADIDAGRIDLVLSSVGNGNCNTVTDALTIWITNGLTASAGPDQSVCISSDNAQLQGSILNGPPAGVWTTSGTGTFAPSPNVLNAQYLFSATDIANGSVLLTMTSTDNGNCVAVQDQMTLTFGNASYAFAGEDINVCANDPMAQLAGNFSGGASGAAWSSSGSGFFSNTTDPNATYTLSSADISSGSVDLTFTTITDGTCAVSSDATTVFVDEIPVVIAGADMVICTSDPVQLSANITHATGVNWTTNGTGTFLDPSALITLYYPSVSDSAVGTIIITATTSGNGECNAVSDDFVMSFGSVLEADAGSDVITCSTSPDVQLSASVTGTSTGVWTTSGTGSFTPSPTDINATYIPGPADFVIGDIRLILSTTANQGCPAGVDTMVVSYNVPPTVNAGQSVILCDGLEDIPLSAFVQDHSSMNWYSTGSGIFSPSDTAAISTYTPTVNDSLAGGVYLILTANGLGTCLGTTDSLFIDIGPTRIADAGQDQVLCADGSDFALNGSIQGVSTGVWSTTGTGTFLPDASALNASYTPSSTDLVFPQLTFILSTTNNQGCPAHNDTMTIDLDVVPVIDAGSDVNICDPLQAIVLDGSFTGTAGIQWSTNGSGTFSPDAFSPTATYQPSGNDSLLQQINIILTGTGLSSCAANSDTMIVSFVNPLTPAFTFSNACAGTATAFSDASIVSNGSIIAWNWTFGTSGIASGPQVSYTFPSAGQYTVSLNVISQNGCSSTIEQVVEILQAPTAGFDISGEFFTGQDISFTDLSFDATNWQYNFGDGLGGSLDQNPIYQYTDPGQFIVVQTVFNAAGCSDSDSLLIIIDSKDILPPKLPNAFSPNGDGVNDIFYVRGGPFETLDMKIYNTWGELIFYTLDPEFGWDGMNGDKPSINGVYVYTINAISTDGKEHSRSGKVTLIR